MTKRKTVNSKPKDTLDYPAEIFEQLKRFKDSTEAAATTTTVRDECGYVKASTTKSRGKNLKPLTKQQKRDIRRNAKAQEARKYGLTLSSNSQQQMANAQSSQRQRAAQCPSPFLSEEQRRDFNIPTNRFLTEGDDGYESVIISSYKGFCYSPRESFSNSFHNKYERALIGLEIESKYKYDIIQTPNDSELLTRTSLSRCVVGEPGITFKQFGLRLFSIPWTPGCVGSSYFAEEIGKLSHTMMRKSHELLLARDEESDDRQFNLTLINRCYPIGQSKFDLHDEPIFKQDKYAVNWHADATLEPFSPVGVYHTTSDALDPTSLMDSSWNIRRKKVFSEETDSRNAEVDSSWRLAMRVYPHANNEERKQLHAFPTMTKADKAMVPPIAVALPSQTAYFLFDDFNHHHEHSLLVGDTHCYSSSHYVSRTEGNTFQSIKAQCTHVLQQRVVYSGAYMRALLHTANELEFEWIRQYYVQGSKHQETHAWWEEPMKELVDVWHELRRKTVFALEVLQDAAVGSCVQLDSSAPTDDEDTDTANKLKKQRIKQLSRMDGVESSSFSIARELLEERVQKRKDWHARQTNIIFDELPAEYHPVSPPLPPYDAAAEELVRVPCRGSSPWCGRNIVSIADEGAEMKSIDVTKILDEGLLAAWKKMFDDIQR